MEKKIQKAVEKSQANTPKMEAFMSNIEEAKYGATEFYKARGQSPTQPRVSIEERKQLVDKMRRENRRNFDHLKGILRGQSPELQSIDFEKTLKDILGDQADEPKPVDLNTTLGEYLKIQQTRNIGDTTTSNGLYKTTAAQNSQHSGERPVTSPIIDQALLKNQRKRLIANSLEPNVIQTFLLQN